MKVEVKNIALIKESMTRRKAYAAIIINDSMEFDGLTVMEGKEGLFVTMPQRQYEDKGNIKYSYIYFPFSKKAREEIIGAVLDAYEKELDKI